MSLPSSLRTSVGVRPVPNRRADHRGYVAAAPAAGNVIEAQAAIAACAQVQDRELLVLAPAPFSDGAEPWARR